MSEADYKEIIEACRPVPCIMIGGSIGPSQQDNANAAWERLGQKMGFDSMTVRPGSTRLEFSAVPSETEDQKQERIKREMDEKRKIEIAKLRSEIADRQSRLQILME